MAPTDTWPVIALRSKRGELEAVSSLGPTLRAQPLLSLELEPDKPRDGLLQRVVRAVHELQDRDCLAMVDASHLPADGRFPQGGAGALEALYDLLADTTDLLRPDPAPFVPVIPADADQQQIAATWRLGEEIGHGCALRARVSTISPRQVADFVAQPGIDPATTDLVLDLGYVDSAADPVVAQVVRLLDDFERQATFRSRTLLSGSVPKLLSHSHAWEQPRYEELVWQAASAAGPRDLRFGDYGVVHPGAEPGRFPSVHMNVKYSCSDHWLYVRERVANPGVEGEQALAAGVVCRGIVESGSFSGPEYSWGDGLIARGAAGSVETLGARSKLIALGTSHHLSYLSGWAAA
ncbi:hypothetical protein [Kribbella sp. NPDC051770]|uniref:beta family protein n=1 Tax=Kribbella sp. NPDC051770 TaxID=3155413 RepID=UPI00342CBD01